MVQYHEGKNIMLRRLHLLWEVKIKTEGSIRTAWMEAGAGEKEETGKHSSWQTVKAVLLGSARSHFTSAGQMVSFDPLCLSPVDTHACTLTHIHCTRVGFAQVYKQNV